MFTKPYISNITIFMTALLIFAAAPVMAQFQALGGPTWDIPSGAVTTVIIEFTTGGNYLFEVVSGASTLWVRCDETGLPCKDVDVGESWSFSGRFAYDNELNPQLVVLSLSEL